MWRMPKHSRTHIPTESASPYGAHRLNLAALTGVCIGVHWCYGCNASLEFCHSKKQKAAGVWSSDGDPGCTSSFTVSAHTHTHTRLYHVWLRKAASERVPLGGLPYAGVQMSKAEQKTPPSCTRSLMSCLDRPVLDVWNVFMCFTDKLEMCVRVSVCVCVHTVLTHVAAGWCSFLAQTLFCCGAQLCTSLDHPPCWWSRSEHTHTHTHPHTQMKYYP